MLCLCCLTQSLAAAVGRQLERRVRRVTEKRMDYKEQLNQIMGAADTFALAAADDVKAHGPDCPMTDQTREARHRLASMVRSALLDMEACLPPYIMRAVDDAIIHYETQMEGADADDFMRNEWAAGAFRQFRRVLVGRAMESARSDEDEAPNVFSSANLRPYCDSGAILRPYPDRGAAVPRRRDCRALASGGSVS